MNKIFSISALAAGMLALASCNDVEPKTPQEDDNDPNAINFSIGQSEASSRTQYSTADDLQIEWVKDDKITIWATPAQGSPTSADYVVSQVIASTKTIDGKEVTTNSKAKIAPTGTALKWSGDVQHTFCGIYGEEASITDVQDGSAKAKLKYSTTQTLVQVNGKWVNMQQAYMVALAKYEKPAESVNLNFHPIMTTLDVQLNGMKDGTEGAKAINVKSMSVTIGEDADVLYSVGDNTYFDIEFNNNGLIGATTSTAKSERTITFVFDPNKLPTVEKDKSITITAILPCIEISENKPVTITVTTDDGTSKSFKFSGPVSAGNKAKIETKPWGSQKSIPIPEAVDLGLSVKWASFNLDASNPEDYGSYYGWGCIEPYATTDYVDWEFYFKMIGGSGKKKNDCGLVGVDPLAYIVNSSGSKNIAGSKWDAAHVKLGGKWRMPTETEWNELINKCSFTDNSSYYTYTSGNGNSIILPTAGYRIVDTVTPGFFYWSSSLSITSTSGAICISGSNSMATQGRCYGCPIRPVWDDRMPEPTEIKAVDLGLPSGTKWANINLGASTIEEPGDYYGWGCTTPYGIGKSADWSTYFEKIGFSGGGEGTCGTSNDPMQSYIVYDLSSTNKPSIAGTKFDAAKQKLSDKWCMPTEADWQELKSNCSWDWYDNYKGSGMNGYEVSRNGNSIFLPAGGQYVGSAFNYVGTTGYYWSAMPGPPDKTNTASLYVNATFFSINNSLYVLCDDFRGHRHQGFTIRPVMK